MRLLVVFLKLLPGEDFVSVRELHFNAMLGFVDGERHAVKHVGFVEFGYGVEIKLQIT